MREALWTFMGAGVYLLGWVMGRRARRSATPETPKPICLCTHSYGNHTGDGGKCRTARLVSIETAKSVKDQWADCPCQRYVGPDPIACGLWVGPSSSA